MVSGYRGGANWADLPEPVLVGVICPGIKAGAVEGELQHPSDPDYHQTARPLNIDDVSIREAVASVVSQRRLTQKTSSLELENGLTTTSAPLLDVRRDFIWTDRRRECDGDREKDFCRLVCQSPLDGVG